MYHSRVLTIVFPILNFCFRIFFFNFQEEISRYKKLYQEMFTERNQLKQQCTQAIRQWDSAIRERNDSKEQYTKVNLNQSKCVPQCFFLCWFIRSHYSLFYVVSILSRSKDNTKTTLKKLIKT